MSELVAALNQCLSALIWASASEDFQAPDGKACLGWARVAQPAIDAGFKVLKDLEVTEESVLLTDRVAALEVQVDELWRAIRILNKNKNGG